MKENDRVILKALERLLSKDVKNMTDKNVLWDIRNILNPELVQKSIKGHIRNIGGCDTAKTLSIEIETSDAIKLEEIIGKDVKVIIQ